MRISDSSCPTSPIEVGLRWNAIPNKPYQIQWGTDLVSWTTSETLTNTNTTDNLPARVNGLRAFLSGDVDAVGRAFLVRALVWQWKSVEN